MNSWIGKFIAAIGIIHVVFGLVVFRSTLAELWNERLLNTVNGQPDREMAFWFLAFGLMVILLGLLVDWVERRSLLPPGFLGWGLAALTALVVVIMPLSGGWLIFIPALALILRARRGRPESARPD